MTSRSCWALVRRQAASIWGFDATILISLQWSRGKTLLGEGSGLARRDRQSAGKSFRLSLLLR